jgi:N-acetylglucosamine-6-phosphate deacetylase
MRPLHHRASALVDVALTDAQLTAMIIADGVHVSPSMLRLALRAKGPEHMALVTDSVRGTKSAWRLRRKRGAFFALDGTLAGSDLTMIGAVRNAVRSGGASLEEAVRMAAEVPARLLGLARERGSLKPGAAADLVAFGNDFRVCFTMVRGRRVYRRNSQRKGS